MTNFIIYSSNNNLNKELKNLIINFMKYFNIHYEIYFLGNDYYNIKERFIGQNIYFLNINEQDKDAYKIAKIIRKDEISIDDQIIFIASNKKYLLNKAYSKTMYYDYIVLDRFYDKKITNCLSEIILLFAKSKVLTFKVDDIIYHIPYNDINYIDKCKFEEWAIIHTKNDTYKCKNNIVYFERILSNDIRFFKTHRSCIVNVKNIRMINTSDSKIFFANDYTEYLSRDHKKELINYFENLNYEENTN